MLFEEKVRSFFAQDIPTEVLDNLMLTHVKEVSKHRLGRVREGVYTSFSNHWISYTIEGKPDLPPGAFNRYTGEYSLDNPEEDARGLELYITGKVLLLADCLPYLRRRGYD